MCKPIRLLILFLLTGCAYRTAVWVTPTEASAAAVTTNLGSLTEVNPVWYSLDANGAIVPKRNAEDPALRETIAARRLVPTIQNFVNGGFDAAVLCRVICEPDARRQHVDALMDLVMKKNFDGIDLDYEAMPPDMRLSFSAFVTLLGTEFHRRNKWLSVTVSAKTSDENNWPGPGGQEWRVIGQVADSVKIMAYDFHWATSGPGPLAPLDWIEKIAAYAATTIPASRQFYALPWYGYDWEGKGGRGVTYESAMRLAYMLLAPVARDEKSGELVFAYGGHEVWFQDAESYRIKVRTILRGRPWIGGFAAWRAGAEDPAVWVDVGELNRRRVRRPASSP